jgi:CheY-like chemotaxis protein
MPHVLVVDDYPGVCPVLQHALESLPDYRVSAAVSSDEVLPLLDRDPPDLIVLDALMPGMSGIELAADASQRGIPVILMTGEAQASEELTASGWRHLQKPFRVDALLAEVHAVLAEAEQTVAMVQASLQRLRETHDEHHRVFSRLRQALLQSQAGANGARAASRASDP